jgi:hypothetical protein
MRQMGVSLLLPQPRGDTSDPAHMPWLETSPVILSDLGRGHGTGD